MGIPKSFLLNNVKTVPTHCNMSSNLGAVTNYKSIDVFDVFVDIHHQILILSLWQKNKIEFLSERKRRPLVHICWFAREGNNDAGVACLMWAWLAYIAWLPIGSFYRLLSTPSNYHSDWKKVYCLLFLIKIQLNFFKRLFSFRYLINCHNKQ